MQTVSDGERIAALERRLLAAEGEVTRMKRRVQTVWVLSLMAAVGGLTLGANPEARAQFGVTLTSLNNRLTAVEDRTQDMSRIIDPNTGQPTVRFSSVNVQVVNGSGNRLGPVNGTGNLIIGYNDWRGGAAVNVRTGSHNLIVGDLNNYTSFGGSVAGIFNTISGQYASVGGGNVNTASNTAASVSGGRFNSASGEYSSVTGGNGNQATNFAATVSGGFERNAIGFYDWVAGALGQDF